MEKHWKEGMREDGSRTEAEHNLQIYTCTMIILSKAGKHTKWVLQGTALGFRDTSSTNKK
jgi:hypothetical protein